MGDVKILLVEDNSIEAADIKKTLESFGYCVPYVASRGSEAIDKILELMPDLILMDIVLKGEQDGIDVASKIKNLNIPVIYLTAYSEESIVKKAKLTKPYGYIIKPYTTKELKSTIELALYNSHQEKILRESEERYRMLYSTINEGLALHKLIYDDNHVPVDYEILDVNPAYEQILGINSKEVLGKKASDAYGAGKAPYLDVYSDVVETKEPTQFETYFEPMDKYFRISVFAPAPGLFATVFEDITKIKKTEESLKESEEQLRLKLDKILSPDYDVGKDEFKNIINTSELQSLMDQFYKITHFGIGILDLNGNILVATGWQDICTKFHRVNAESCKNCIESDVKLTKNLQSGEYRNYKCKNNMWDISTPIIIGGKHMGNVFLGQFFYDDEEIDYALFEAQAEKFGFDKKEYLQALKKVPRWSREQVNAVIKFYSQLAQIISKLSYSNIKLAKALSDYKRAQNELRESEKFLDNVVENIPNLVFVKNAEDLTYKRVNKILETYFGISQKELAGKTDFDIFNKAEADFLTKKDRQVLHSGELLDIPEESLQIKDLGQRWLQTKKIPLLDSEGNPQYILGISEDITDRKKAEELLRENEEKYRTLFESNPDYTIMVGLDGVILDVNSAAVDFTNLSREELIGENYTKLGLFPEKDLPFMIEQFTQVLKGQIVGPFQYKLINKEGTYSWAEAKLVPLLRHGKVYSIMVIATDITDRKTATDQLKSSIKEKEVLLKEIHHRVKNNMQIISSLLSLQKQSVENEESDNILLESQNRIKSMAMIHERLYHTGNLTKINISEYIERLVSDLFYSYSISTLKVSRVIDVDDIMLNIETALPCGLIINEIVSNSLKYAFPPGRKGEIYISLKTKGDWKELIIADDGIGLPEGMDFKNTETLGLQLVNSLVEQIDGKITLNQEKGTSFKIKFKGIKYKERI